MYYNKISTYIELALLGRLSGVGDYIARCFSPSLRSYRKAFHLPNECKAVCILTPLEIQKPRKKNYEVFVFWEAIGS